MLGRALTCKQWSAKSWGLALVAVCALASLTRVLVSYVVFPYTYLWLHWNPGRPVGYWLLGTPLAPIAAHVRFFVTIYVPDCVVLFLGGLAIGSVFFRRWIQLSVVFLLVFTVVSDLAGVSTVRTTYIGLRSADWDQTLRFAVFTVTIFGCLFTGAWLGARYLARRPSEEGHCRRCGYDLTGLPEPRCPECGERFL